MSMPNDALAAVRKDEIGVHGEECVEFGLDGLHDQLSRPRAQDFGERIVDFVFLSERDDSILVHGVTLLLGDSGGLVTNPVTPPSSPRHPVSRIAPSNPQRGAQRMIALTQKEIVEGVTDALAALIPDDINDDYRADTGRLMSACCKVLGDDFQPGEIKDALTSLKNGYGGWLDWVREAIKETEVLSDVDRAALLGAFEMATAFLFDIEAHNQPGLKT
jgi:hypothetical protein